MRLWAALAALLLSASLPAVAQPLEKPPSPLSPRGLAVFRATRIPPDHPGLAARKLAPLEPQPPWAPQPAPAGEPAP